MHGDIHIFFDAIGTPVSDARVMRALDFVGGDYQTEEFSQDPDNPIYFDWPDRGVEILVEAGVVKGVFIEAHASGEKAQFPKFDALIEGVSANSTRAEIEALFGKPARSSADFAIFDVGIGFLRFLFDADTLTQLTAVRELGGSSPAKPGSVAASVPPAGMTESTDKAPKREQVGGGIEAFLSAIGCAQYSPEHVALIALAGVAMETQDRKVDGVTWHYQNFPKTGVLVKFKKDELVGALIRVHSVDAETVYPYAGELFTDLELPAPRATVTDYMGTPDQSSQYMDLFVMGDRFLRFDYADGQCDAVSLGILGVGV